jgi:hypothetical protein
MILAQLIGFSTCFLGTRFIHLNQLLDNDIRGAGAAGAAAPLPFVDGGSGDNFALCS